MNAVVGVPNHCMWVYPLASESALNLRYVLWQIATPYCFNDLVSVVHSILCANSIVHKEWAIVRKYCFFDFVSEEGVLTK